MSDSILDRDACQDCRAPLWFTGTYVFKTEQGVPRKLCETCFKKRFENQQGGSGNVG